MKHCIFPFLLFVLLLGVTKTDAQTQSVDTTIVSGHFEIDTLIGSSTNHINVNYALSARPFTTNMNVVLHTPDPILFNVDILDASNTVVTTWTPATISNSYIQDIDITALLPGIYHVNIRKYSTSGVLYTIPFTK